jgi:RimJ/RimL family protein N-acetyltransferase
MRPTVREMHLDEVGLVIEYFHGSTAEHLEMLGVDPTRLPDRDRWRARYERDYARPRPERETMLVLWELDGAPVGFSTSDRIAYGEQAFMHLHIVEAGHRRAGVGAAAVRASVELYFNELGLRRLFCEPNAFNTAPNRALQRAGFRYVKTHMTVPGPLNFHQTVTRWVIER